MPDNPNFNRPGWLEQAIKRQRERGLAARKKRAHDRDQGRAQAAGAAQQPDAQPANLGRGANIDQIQAGFERLHQIQELERDRKIREAAEAQRQANQPQNYLVYNFNREAGVGPNVYYPPPVEAERNPVPEGPPQPPEGDRVEAQPVENPIEVRDAPAQGLLGLAEQFFAQAEGIGQPQQMAPNQGGFFRNMVIGGPEAPPIQWRQAGGMDEVAPMDAFGRYILPGIPPKKAAPKKNKEEEVEQVPKLEGNPIDLDHYFGTTANRIQTIGIEVEGAWAKVPKMGWGSIHHDASVFKGVAVPIRVEAKGEIASPPLIPAAKTKWLADNYPQYVDSTCGLHIHMKFKKAHYYSILMDSPDYQATILAYLTKWAKEEGLPEDHCIWDRLAGKNKYCKPDYWPDLQVLQKIKPRNVEAVAGTKGHRYTICNFCWGLGNQTMEVRVLPMLKDSVMADRALSVIIQVTNAYLRYMMPKNQKAREEYTKSLTASCKIVLEEDDEAGRNHIRVYA